MHAARACGLARTRAVLVLPLATGMSLALCLRAAGLWLTTRRDAMKQECDHASSPLAPDAWERETVTCHHVRGAAALGEIHAAVARARGYA
jgi:hypothetical protein